jgi:tellurite methyltransferase
MNKDFWNIIYKHDRVSKEPSTFAHFCEPILSKAKSAVELGCGNGRDLYYLKSKGIRIFGVDASNEDLFILRQDVGTYIKNNDSPDMVYTRFFWHAIERPLQLEILHWVKDYIFIEARTTKDKPKNVVGRHSRSLVNTSRLKRDLEAHGFTIQHFSEGTGLSLYKGEDPHLVRVIAHKS